MKFKSYVTFSIVVGSLSCMSFDNSSDYNIIKSSVVHASKDQKISNWAKPYLDAMRTGGLIPNKLASSDLTQNITREEFAELITTYVNKAGKKYEPNKNATFSDTQNPLIMEAAKLGIVAGMGDGTFKPSQQTNRQEISTMTLRAEKLVRPGIVIQKNTTMFTDGYQVGSWAKEGVSFMHYDGVIAGYPDKSFKPTNKATREQAIKIVAELAAKKGFVTINQPVTPTNPTPQNPVASKPANGSSPINQHGIPQNPKPAPQTIAGFTPDIVVGYHTKAEGLDSYFQFQVKNALELGNRRDITVKVECISHPQLNKLNLYNAVTRQWNVVDKVVQGNAPMSQSRADNLYSMPRITSDNAKDMNGKQIVIKDGEMMEYKITMSTGSEKIEITQYAQFKDKNFTRKY